MKTNFIVDNQTPTVLVVDDEIEIAELMRDFLEVEGFQVELAHDGRAALRLLEYQPIDCVLLDVMMPDVNGFELCRRIRENRDLPILFLSARGEDLAKIRGLGLGGDDYIVKSATPHEVVARIKAVLRRYKAGSATPPATLNFGRLLIDLRARKVLVEGREVAFAAREFDLLTFLAEHPYQVLTRDQLFEHFWGEIGDRHTVTVHVRRIREKIEIDPNQPQYVQTVWGVGYRFEGKKL